MKKITVLLYVFIACITLSPLQIWANENALKIESTNPKEIPAQVKTMLNRLEDIKKMDKSGLTRVEKKELRAEVKGIKKSLKASGNGIYLSIGAIIIIILLLILLL